MTTFKGSCELKSNHSLEELAIIISTNVFGGVPFGGIEKCIYEEIPAVFINVPILGMFITLEGYSGIDEGWFVLSIKTYSEFDLFLDANNLKQNKLNIDTYLYYLLKNSLSNYPEIVIIPPAIHN